jgi:cytochrome c553
MKILKWLGIGVGAILALAAVLVLGLFLRGRGKASSAPEIVARSIPTLTDSAALARGRHIATAITGCEMCHGGPGLGGQQFPTPAMLVSMAAPNLTRGQGGIGASYTSADWDRALRHGIGKDGRSLMIMPSEAYTHLSDADLAALATYLQSIPAKESAFPPRKIGLLGGALIGAGAFPLAPAMIAHDSVGARSAVPAVDAEYGQYLASVAGCRTCHGSGLEGMKAGGGGPPPGPSLVAFSQGRTVDDFRRTIRTGRSPTGGGRALNPEYMPWPVYARMTDDELQAIWLYLQSVATVASR